MTTEHYTTAAPNAPDTEAQRKLAALRARRAQLEDERAQLEAPTEAEQLETEERAVADAEAINRAIQEHGRVDREIAIVRSSLGVVILKRCGALRYKKFQDADDFSVESCERLLRPNVIYPTITTLDDMLEKQPMIAMHCANALGRLAGVRKEDVQKK
jgi:hypothetical protein